jgi:dienelactone hydrolase
MRHLIVLTVMTSMASIVYCNAAEAADTSRGDEMLAAYFRAETQKVAAASLPSIKTFSDWTHRRDEYRRQLREMLGMEPMPERTLLNAVVTGKLERDDFTVEKVHFQSRPHLYVTGNLYLPKKSAGRAPAILYVCGHSNVKKDGVSYGSKVAYQHYGAWFARNGYVCLVIDTLQLGEIEGVHHGTYREGLWWWNSRGYTPAGVETWNSIRAIDYLASRPEVDADRIGMTGRSGGGAYTWYVTALDDRVKVAVPAAGITTLKNHVVDGCVARHCDCMYFVSTYRWDFARLAALSAPKPLLVLNTESDPLFPLDGVTEIYQHVRRLYELDGRSADIALKHAVGAHEDSRKFQLYTIQWFDKYLMGKTRSVENEAKDFLEPEELKVFQRLPADEINTRIHEEFVPAAVPPVMPESQSDWAKQRDEWMEDLREKCFAGWPVQSEAESTKAKAAQLVFDANAGDVRFRAYDFDSQENVRLRLFVVTPSNVPATDLAGITLRSKTAGGWKKFLSSMRVDFANELQGESLAEPDAESYALLREALAAKRGVAFVAPRGTGPTALSGDTKQQTQVRRRFMLLGQTLDGMRVWDVRRAIQTLRSINGFDSLPLSLAGDMEMSGIVMYAALFEPNVDEVSVSDLPASHRVGPDLLNVLQYLDMPQTVAMVAERADVRIKQNDEDGWEYPLAVSKNLGWTRRIEITRVDGRRDHDE